MDRNKPKVSVVMSICNEPLQWIRLAVESIQNQTYKNFEIIIVCDNPAFEEGIAYIRQAAAEDSRICLLINDTNLGPTKSFNKAIDAAEGEYITEMRVKAKESVAVRFTAVDENGKRANTNAVFMDTL